MKNEPAFKQDDKVKVKSGFYREQVFTARVCKTIGIFRKKYICAQGWYGNLWFEEDNLELARGQLDSARKKNSQKY